MALGCGEAVIAIELAHDLDDAVDRSKVEPLHGAVSHQQRLVETAHLHRQELGGRRGHAAGENLPNQGAHALLRYAHLRRDLGD